jgi:hypothetical protein
MEIIFHSGPKIAFYAPAIQDKKMKTRIKMGELDRVLHDCKVYGEDPQTFSTVMVNNAIAELTQLRADLDGAISQQHKYLRLNVEFHNHNVQLRAENEGHKIIEAQQQSELETARSLIRALSQHDDYIGRKTVMQIADEYLSTHPAENNTESI